MRARTFVFAGLLVAACSSDADAPPSTTDPAARADGGDWSSNVADAGTGEGGVIVPGGDASTSTDASAGDAAPQTGAPPIALPVTFTRPDQGTPLTAAELTAATDELIALLKDTHYFDVVDERLHGWPESDPNHGYWFGTWWSGVHIYKENGAVRYVHTAGGADKNGLRTPPYLEGACYAHLLWGDTKTAKLVRKMVRGYSSWALSMVRQNGDTNPTLLSRAHYPANVVSTDGGRTISIDYSANRPGEDNDATEYVHIPNNPTFGDIWIKNKRSKDDIGHMFRSIAQVDVCRGRLDAAGQADIDEMRALYAKWSQRVEADQWGIATLDKSLNLFVPPISETLAHYTLAGGVECPGALAIRFAGAGNPGPLDCGNGFTATEKLTLSLLKNGNRQILRTHHEAATNWAHLTGATGPGLTLLQGLAERVQVDLDLVDKASPPDNINPTDVAAMMLHAANAGVPLTSREVRWLHGRLHTAYTTMRQPQFAPIYSVFAASTPDGEYSYDPPSDGLFYSDLGVLIGSCASAYRNPSARPLLDCNRLIGAFSP